MTEIELIEKSPPLERQSAEELVRWAWQAFGEDVVATSSFQTQSLPLLHVVSQVAPHIPILFLDTGFHFPETLQFRDELVERWGLRLEVVESLIGHSELLRREGELHRTDPDRCCHLNKVMPLDRALQGRRAWITGVRQDQTAARSEIPKLSLSSTGLVKICPIVDWNLSDVDRYVREHHLPEHPLTKHGFSSIGCAPCTRPGSGRDGRWQGHEKTECGLHNGRRLRLIS